MDNFSIYTSFCEESSKEVTKKYSTSFFKAIQLFPADIKQDIYNIYGFVRLADEIVDTFHDYDKEKLLNQFKDTYQNGLEDGISLHPIIHGFCKTQKQNNIDQALVDAFLASMQMDLGEMKDLDDEQYKEYIYGSAEVVGLMCLKVFVKGNDEEYEQLKPYAQSFGAALQKVNFLRDISADFHQLNRVYFPNVNFEKFSESAKIKIEKDIEQDFKNALIGIKKLPKTSKTAVYLAYLYYNKLFKQIKKTHHEKIFSKRISVPNYEKTLLFAQMMVKKYYL